MPVYEFRCIVCAELHDVDCRTGKGPEFVECPSCRGDCLRVYSVPAVHFKGPGFYSTDNRKGGGDGVKES